MSAAGGRFRGEAERFAFAGAIAYPDLLDESGLAPEHFATEIIGQAFAAIPQCGRTTDDRLSVVELAAHAGIPVETLRPVLQAQVFTADQARGWWTKVRDLATTDAVLGALRGAMAKPLDASSTTGATGALLAEVARVVQSFSEQDDDGETETLLDATSRFVEERSLELRHGRRRGVETGLEIVDEWMGGLNAGELTTIVAAGGVGKSTVAMDIARRVAAQGPVVLYWSAEMTGRQVGQREAHAALGRAISDRSVSAVDLAEGLETLKNAHHGDRVRLHYGARPKAAQLLATARRVQNRGGLGLLIFDHLGCFDCERPRASEQEQVAFAVTACKDLAKILEVPFLLITHLNRQGQIRGSERVKDISDNVLELKRDPDNQRAFTEARLLKARQTGETWKAMNLEYSMRWQRFLEVGEIVPTRDEPTQGYRRSGGGPTTAAMEAPAWPA